LNERKEIKLKKQNLNFSHEMTKRLAQKESENASRKKEDDEDKLFFCPR